MDEMDTAIMDLLRSTPEGLTPPEVHRQLEDKGVPLEYRRVYRKMKSLARYSFLDCTKEPQMDGGGFQLRFTVKGVKA